MPDANLIALMQARRRKLKGSASMPVQQTEAEADPNNYLPPGEWEPTGTGAYIDMRTGNMVVMQGPGAGNVIDVPEGSDAEAIRVRQAIAEQGAFNEPQNLNEQFSGNNLQGIVANAGLQLGEFGSKNYSLPYAIQSAATGGPLLEDTKTREERLKKAAARKAALERIHATKPRS